MRGIVRCPLVLAQMPLQTRLFLMPAGRMPRVSYFAAVAFAVVLATTALAIDSKSLSVVAWVEKDHAVNRLVLFQSLGAGVDGHEGGECARLFSDAAIAEMLSAGLGPL